jgi:hypothetical protein
LALLVLPAVLVPRIATAQAHHGTHTARRGTDPVIAAAGDIACDPTNPLFDAGVGTSGWCRAAKTAAVIAKIAPDALLPLGDAQYNTGTLSQYKRSYALSWGGYMSTTHPTPGNHDYESSVSALGYFAYFGARAVPPGASTAGYYSYDLGAWHLISLNSNCAYVACGPGSPQYRWLKSDLIANTSACTLAYWHAPRYSSGPHGNDTAVQPFWHLLYRHGADVVLNGHDHIYERFTPQSAVGAKDATHGLREFVVGTGGAQHYWIGTVKAHSVIRNTETFGVLKMTLHPTGYRWNFQPIAGKTFTDGGTGVCHGPPV